MWHDLLVAFALVLVIEGILPFLNPGAWRRMMLMLSQMDNRTLRFAGLSSMTLGVILLYLLR
jgi:uncharacterized protein